MLNHNIEVLHEFDDHLNFFILFDVVMICKAKIDVVLYPLGNWDTG